MQPILSIITVNYNSSNGLYQTICSVIKIIKKVFLDEEFELIIIDGASSDQSLTSCYTYLNFFNNIQIISEKDEGIYDAMNKGLSLFNGRFIYFLNSGDEAYCVETWIIVKEYLLLNIPSVSFQTIQHFENDYYLRGINNNQLQNPQLISHQGIIINRSIINGIFFNRSIGNSADTDFLTKVITSKPFPIFKPGALFALGGVSNNPITLNKIYYFRTFIKKLLFFFLDHKYYYKLIYLFKYKKIKINDI